jgi:hypothetical protein
MPTSLVFKKVHSRLASIFSSLQPSLTILKNKAKFKAASTKLLHTHPFKSVDELFMYKDD